MTFEIRDPCPSSQWLYAFHRHILGWGAVIGVRHLKITRGSEMPALIWINFLREKSSRRSGSAVAIQRETNRGQTAGSAGPTPAWLWRRLVDERARNAGLAFLLLSLQSFGGSVIEYPQKVTFINARRVSGRACALTDVAHDGKRGASIYGRLLSLTLANFGRAPESSGAAKPCLSRSRWRLSETVKQTSYLPSVAM